ncbi:keratin, type I cytoskeletal 9 [Zeugodacus cucurbitae]|uniref:Uncharacterized protein n=1 Tax=Zeugodacus cucurbitae TaxID=28588 RepID=A0A0A1WPR6_ZEUCU|nr:keratin, type I cytoskeletal 9 [Zeugodacus cucurbitae]
MKFFVFYGAAVVLLALNAYASAPTKAEARIRVAVKPKREAPLSSGYHGPSYKYLPPSSAAIGSNYNSYSSHGSSSSAASFGASGSAGLGYDYAHASAPKIETYIVQTEPAHSVHSSGGSSGSHHYTGHGSASHSAGGGYRYSSGAASHYSSAGAALLGHSGISSGGGHYKYQTKARPHVQTLILPAQTLTHGAVGSSSSSGGIHSSVNHGSGFGGAHGNFGSVGYQYAPTFGSSSHSTAGSGFGGAHGSAFAGAHSSAGAAFSGHSSANLGGHSVTYNPQQGYSYNGHSGINGAAFALGNSAHGAQFAHGGSSGGGATITFNNQDGYSNQEYASHSAPSIPSTSYGVPAGPAVASYHGGAADAGGNSYHGSADETPAYAVGHKGLGHFSFSASKPHALQSNFISSGNSVGHSEHSGRAPFKPSTLLGTSYEVSGPAAQYLPPTSPGYEYQSHAVLQGGAAAAGHINEPDSAYLPPVSTPGASYLPPQQH